MPVRTLAIGAIVPDAHLSYAFGNNSLRQGAQVTDQSELNSRAALCRKLAQREPANRTLWMAEAENWSRLSKKKPHREDSVEIDSGILARLHAQSTRFLFILA
jgi:hypothetical protein